MGIKSTVYKAIKESQEMLNLVPKLFVKPGEAFSRIIEIAEFQKLINFLIIYYICFSPFVFLLGIFLIFPQVEPNMLTIIFSIPFLLIAAVVSCAAIGGYTLIVSYVFSGIYYFLGKLFKAEGEYNDVLSAMVLYVAATAIITVPIRLYKDLSNYIVEGLDVSGLNIVYIGIIFLLSVIYIPSVLSKSLKINLPRAFILTILPYLIFFIGSFLGFILI